MTTLPKPTQNVLGLFFSHLGPGLFLILGSSTKALSVSHHDPAVTAGFNLTHSL